MHPPRESAVLEDAVEGCAAEECDCDRDTDTRLVRHRLVSQRNLLATESREYRR